MANDMRTVLVSGGSRGVGLAIAEKLSAEGYRVLAPRPARRQATLCAPPRPRRRLCISCPTICRTWTVFPNWCASSRSTARPALRLLVNNAALGSDGLLSNMHNSDIEKLVRLNTLSPIILSKYAVRGMMTTGEGRIVNISSIIAATGYSGLSVYGATKASMLGFTRSLAREVGRLGVTVNAVAPGFMQTEMTQSLGAEQQDKIARRSALGRLAEVGDVANAVAFLMGEGGRNITGTVMTVDAGNTA